eukprot:6288596-Pyramimonas_sp.AAC.1
MPLPRATPHSAGHGLFDISQPDVSVDWVSFAGEALDFDFPPKVLRLKILQNAALRAFAQRGAHAEG